VWIRGVVPPRGNWANLERGARPEEPAGRGRRSTLKILKDCVLRGEELRKEGPLGAIVARELVTLVGLGDAEEPLLFHWEYR
jgi:hypothetical protein